MNAHSRKLLFALGASCVPFGLALAQEETQLTELEAFIAEETSVEDANNLLPTSRPIDSVFFTGMDIVDIPRSVTVLTPEALEQYNVEGFDDLTRVGAGFSRPNIFGIPGAPFIRGENASTYLNGNRRIFNQNETPTSFGSLESIDLVKGPAPVQYGPSNAGGYANFIPKAPYFDEFRGSVDVTVGSYDLFRTEVDIGGPMLFLDKPMAYRVSITNQLANSYYNDVKNDYLSVYGSVKIRIADGISLYTGAEYFDYRSNENAGWNRVTQDLIDNGRYIIGDMDPNTVAQFSNAGGINVFTGGTADLDLIDDFFPTQNAIPSGVVDPNLAIVVPAGIFQDRFGAPSGANSAYTAGDSAAAAATTPIFDPATGALYGYKYTPDYFANGGELFTTNIDGNQVLSDPSDFADSQNFVWFADLVFDSNPDFIITNKFFAEILHTQKYSSYGFAHFTDSFAIRYKPVVDHVTDFADFQYGLDFSYEVVDDINDFFVEPFNRRDISRNEIVPQSIVLAGPEINYAYNRAFGGAGSWKTYLFQAAAFAQMKKDFGERVTLLVGGRAEMADFEIGETEHTNTGAPTQTGQANFVNGSASLVVRPVDGISLYGNVQLGTVFDPDGAGSVSAGEDNFSEAELYEAGIKWKGFDDTLFATISAYHWDKTTVSQTPIGADGNALRSKGIEFELNYKPNDNFTLVANIASQRTQFRGAFPFTTAPMTPEEVALYSGAIMYDVVNPTSVRYENNPDFIRSGLPEVTANLFAIYEMDNGFGIGIGPSYRESFYLDNERTLKLPSVIEWNANLFYRNDRFEVFLRLNNFTDEEYFVGSSFAPTMIVTKAEPFNAELSAKIKF